MTIKHCLHHVLYSQKCSGKINSSFPFILQSENGDAYRERGISLSYFKNLIFLSLLILSVSTLWTGCQELFHIPPAEAYVDAGVKDFIPYRVYPTQVENTTSSRRDRRMHPTKTVYQLTYLAADGSGYQWTMKVRSRAAGQKLIAEGRMESRRILKLADKRTFVPALPDETAQSYTAAQQKRCLFLIIPAAVYILLYLILSLFFWMRRRQR